MDAALRQPTRVPNPRRGDPCGRPCSFAAGDRNAPARARGRPYGTLLNCKDGWISTTPARPCLGPTRREARRGDPCGRPHDPCGRPRSFAAGDRNAPARARLPLRVDRCRGESPLRQKNPAQLSTREALKTLAQRVGSVDQLKFKPMVRGALGPKCVPGKMPSSASEPSKYRSSNAFST